MNSKDFKEFIFNTKKLFSKIQYILTLKQNTT